MGEEVWGAIVEGMVEFMICEGTVLFTYLCRRGRPCKESIVFDVRITLMMLQSSVTSTSFGKSGQADRLRGQSDHPV